MSIIKLFNIFFNTDKCLLSTVILQKVFLNVNYDILAHSVLIKSLKIIVDVLIFKRYVTVCTSNYNY